MKLATLVTDFPKYWTLSVMIMIKVIIMIMIIMIIEKD